MTELLLKIFKRALKGTNPPIKSLSSDSCVLKLNNLKRMPFSLFLYRIGTLKGICWKPETIWLSTEVTEKEKESYRPEFPNCLVVAFQTSWLAFFTPLIDNYVLPKSKARSFPILRKFEAIFHQRKLHFFFVPMKG